MMEAFAKTVNDWTIKKSTIIDAWQGPKYTSVLCVSLFKVCVRYFHQIFIFHQMIVLQKLWKMLFISSKMLFSFSRYSIFCIFVLPYFSTCRCFREWSKINLEIHDVINSLKKSSITNFIWYLEKEKRYDHEILSINGVSDKERSYRKIMQKMYSKS